MLVFFLLGRTGSWLDVSLGDNPKFYFKDKQVGA